MFRYEGWTGPSENLKNYTSRHLLKKIEINKKKILYSIFSPSVWKRYLKRSVWERAIFHLHCAML